MQIVATTSAFSGSQREIARKSYVWGICTSGFRTGKGSAVLRSREAEVRGAVRQGADAETDVLVQVDAEFLSAVKDVVAAD